MPSNQVPAAQPNEMAYNEIHTDPCWHVWSSLEPKQMLPWSLPKTLLFPGLPAPGQHKIQTEPIHFQSSLHLSG